MTTSRVITCAMLDANGYYNGAVGSLDEVPMTNDDFVFQGPCTIRVHGNIRTNGNIKGMNGVTVIVDGEVTCNALEDINITASGGIVETGA